MHRIAQLPVTFDAIHILAHSRKVRCVVVPQHRPLVHDHIAGVNPHVVELHVPKVVANDATMRRVLAIVAGVLDVPRGKEFSSDILTPML